jgi:hypothetical protein
MLFFSQLDGPLVAQFEAAILTLNHGSNLVCLDYDSVFSLYPIKSIFDITSTMPNWARRQWMTF